jgi:endonuclease YncB( thermonuclease family)
VGQVAQIWHFALLALVLASAAHAETDNDTIVRPTAKPRFQIVDGDTVKFGPQLVRLFGIDAPEKSQTCDDGHGNQGL